MRVRMETKHNSGCTELLLDLMCYGMCLGTIPGEVEWLFRSHLEVCPSCRAKVDEYAQALGRCDLTRISFRND
jgi:hypothetical protein